MLKPTECYLFLSCNDSKYPPTNDYKILYQKLINTWYTNFICYLYLIS